MNRVNREKGFTLVEVLFALMVALILLSAIYAVVESGQRSSVSLERKVAANQDARAALQMMAMEVRMASYNPNFETGFWLNSDCGNSPSPNLLYKGIQEASPYSLTVEMDIDESSVIGDYPNEILRYAYDGANQFITRNSNCQGGQSFLGDNPGSGVPRSVRVINDADGNGVFDAATDIPVFTYFDGAGNQIPFASLPANIPNIRRIDITLQVETDEITPDTGQRRKMIYSTSVIARNHATIQ
jgi:prepilin-type N-terminal cleavage/methylation domain-containing protein